MDAPFVGDGTIDFVGAGRQDSNYALRVNLFSWPAFYERLGGNELLQRIQSELRSEYDYILIDSRSGLSDYAGICTTVLPDTVVACFTLNSQSLDGSVMILEKIRALRAENPPAFFPVLMRVDKAEKEILEQRRNEVRRRFEQLVPPSRPPEYWAHVEFPYVPYYSYNEILSVFADQPFSTGSLLAAAESLAAYLTDGRVTRTVPLSPEIIERVRQAYSLPSQRFEKP